MISEGGRAEIYDPDTGTFTPTHDLTNLSYNDGLPTATLLMNGKVLVAGGANDEGIHTNAELYAWTNGTFTPSGHLTTGRNGQTATLLPDGNVLMACTFLFGPGAVTLASTELYDPVSDRFTPAGDMTTPRGSGHTATLLNDGRCRHRRKQRNLTLRLLSLLLLLLFLPLNCILPVSCLPLLRCFLFPPASEGRALFLERYDGTDRPFSDSRLLPEKVFLMYTTKLDDEDIIRQTAHWRQTRAGLVFWRRTRISGL